MKKDTEICQSCGMPMGNESLLGTEKDGSKNHEYCTYCYRNGAFVNPSMSLAEMTGFVKDFLEKEKQPGVDVGKAVQGIAHLKRWQKQ